MVFGSSVLSTISDSDLFSLKRAIVLEQCRRRSAICEDKSADICAKIKETIARGFSVTIETDTDEITVQPDDLLDLVVTVKDVESPIDS